jgi:Rieske Fe-S protein
MAVTEPQPGQAVSRRGAICTAAGACAGIGALGLLLSACGSDNSGGSSDASSASPPPSSGSTLAKVSDVPVGGGKLVTAPGGMRVMLTQPTQGVFKAFDARCTHQGTIVDPPQKGIMTCPNHGSQFATADGSVRRGPATAPLDTVAVQVKGDSIVTV